MAPSILGLASFISLWIMQVDPVGTGNGNGSGGNIFGQLADYGLVGVVIALIAWGLQYFEKRSDKERLINYKEVASYKKELSQEREDRKKIEQEYHEKIEKMERDYLAQIKVLQEEITKLKVNQAEMEIKLSLLKNKQGD